MRRFALIVVAGALALALALAASCDLLFGPREIAGKACVAGQCPSGFTCASGVCEPVAQDGAIVAFCGLACTDDSACDTGQNQHCLHGACQTLVPCVDDSSCTTQTGSSSFACVNHALCLPKCTQDSDCGTGRCDPQLHFCQGCTSDSDCTGALTHCGDIGASSGLHELDGVRVCGCASSSQCTAASGSGDVCTNGFCGCSSDAACKSPLSCVHPP